MGIGRAPAACGVPAALRRATARLLVLTMLLLAAAPVAWPSAAAADRDATGHAAAAFADCGSLDHGASGHPPVDRGRAVPRHGAQDDAAPGLGCCLGLLCPMLAAKLPAAVAQRVPLPHGRAATVPDARRPAGLDIPPALPPPRGAA